MKTTVQRRPHQLPIVWPMMMLGLLITSTPNEYLNQHIVTRAKPKTSQRASPSSSCGRARRWAPPRRQTPPPPIQAQAQRVRAGKNLIVRTRCTAIWHQQVGKTPPRWRSSQIMWVNIAMLPRLVSIWPRLNTFGQPVQFLTCLSSLSLKSFTRSTTITTASPTSTTNLWWPDDPCK